MMKVMGRSLAAIASICLLYLNSGSFATAGTLLPPGENTFVDQNGAPLASGCVFFYVPGTNTPKNTYQDAAQTILNSNPVQLDAAGRAIIYGSGTYRQVVNATGANPSTPCSPAGAQVWDQLTASTDTSNTIYAGASAGTPNAITVTATAFTGTDGQVINYISTNTNTGAATINPSSFGNVAIVRDGSTGPAALTGGELVATNAVSLIYDATAGTFHILSPVTWPNTSGVPVGTMISVAGFTAPTGYAFAYGQAVSRTTYSSLLTALTSAQSGTIAASSPTITGLSDTTQFAKGMAVESVGIPLNTTIQSCTSTTCTMSANATASRTGTITFFAYGDGDGSTTFSLPDLRGKTLVARDNLGGTAANIDQITANLSTTASSTSATVASATGLAIGMTLSGNVNVPAGTTISAISGTTITLSQSATATQSNVSTRFSVFPDAQGLGVAGGNPTHVQLQAELPNVNFTVSGITLSNGALTINGNPFNGGCNAGTGSLGTNCTGGSQADFVVTTSAATSIGPASSVVSVATQGTAASGGSGIAQPVLQPSLIVNWAVKLTP